VMRRFGREPVPHPDEVRRQTDRVLGLLSRRGIRATFFVLGRTAASVPALVRRIVREGHEVATHGYDHEPIADGEMDAFAEDLRRAKAELEDLIGEEVIGYRAPAFSVPGGRRQAFFEVLARAGIRYDSSVVPVAMSRYGIGGFGLAPCRVPTAAGGEVLEFPLSLVPWAGRLWMVAGGGYWRLFPAWLLRRAVRKVRADGRPLVTYLHNYEFDARALRVRRMRARPRELRTWEIRSNLFRRTIPRKLVELLSEFPFAPFRDVLDRVGAADRPGAAPGESDDE
jgi:polysaccharide deacetylase family protein (PEP-CTERM system associated)